MQRNSWLLGKETSSNEKHCEGSRSALWERHEGLICAMEGLNLWKDDRFKVHPSIPVSQAVDGETPRTDGWPVHHSRFKITENVEKVQMHSTKWNLSILTASSQTDNQMDKETAKRPIIYDHKNFNTPLWSVYCNINGEKNHEKSFIGYFFLFSLKLLKRKTRGISGCLICSAVCVLGCF